MKILHIIGLAHGGAGQHVLSLASECDPRRFDSTVAMTASSPMRPDFEKAGVRVLPLALDHYGGPLRNLMAFRQLAEILKGEAFDIIQTHTSVAGALGRVAARMYSHAPVVHMLHAFAGHPYRSGPFRVAARQVERRLDRFTDWYIAGSQAMIRSGVKQRIFTADKVKLISNGIDLTPFRTAEVMSQGAASGSTSGALPDDDAMTVGFLGRLEEQKGAPYLIQAAAIVKRQNPRIRFVLAGDGKLRSQLEKLTAELHVEDVVTFAGWQSDTVGFLRHIDVMAMPSLWEAFGLSAAEAMAIEKPVIASRVDGLPEVVEDGVTGILVPPAEPEPLARAILQLAADPQRRRAMGVQGRNRVEALFSLDSMIERHETFYERVGGERRTRQLPARQTASAEELALSVHA
jgi:glycosyltransferase involved in cell wall biosynthesis